MTPSAAELFRALAWRVMPDAMRGGARDGLAHGTAPGASVRAERIRESERLAGVRERGRARALRRSRKGKR